MKDYKLLPCPFCGKKVTLTDDDTLYPSGILWRDDPEIGLRTYHSRREQKEGDGMCYTMHCPVPSGGCGAEITGDSEEEAVASWNRRHHGALQIAIDEAVRRALEPNDSNERPAVAGPLD